MPSLSRRLRATERGYVQSVPKDHSHLLVHNSLKDRMCDQLKALQLHQSCNQIAGKDYHYLRDAVLATSHVIGGDATRKGLRINQTAATSRHEWTRCPRLHGSSDGVFLATGYRDGHAVAVWEKAILCLDELVEQDNSLLAGVASGCMETEVELEGSSILLYPEFTNPGCFLELANGGIGEGTQDVLHDKGAPVSRGLSMETVSLDDGYGRVLPEHEHGGKWFDAFTSEGSDDDEVFFVKTDDRDVGAVNDDNEKKISEKGDFDEEPVENTFLHGKVASVSCGLSMEMDSLGNGFEGVLHERVHGGKWIDAFSCEGSDDEEVHHKKTDDSDVCVDNDEHEKKNGEKGDFDEEPVENTILHGLHDTEWHSSSSSWKAASIKEDNTDVLPDNDKMHEKNSIGRARVWEHLQLEPILAAPWRRRHRSNISGVLTAGFCSSSTTYLYEKLGNAIARRSFEQVHVENFNIAASDSSGDQPQEPTMPPGQFNFCTRPGFGIRNLIENGQYGEGAKPLQGDSIELFAVVEDNSLHACKEITDNGNLHDDPEPMVPFFIPCEFVTASLQKSISRLTTRIALDGIYARRAKHDLDIAHVEDNCFQKLSAIVKDLKEQHNEDLRRCKFLQDDAALWRDRAHLWRDNAELWNGRALEERATSQEEHQNYQALLRNMALSYKDLFSALGVVRDADEILGHELFHIVDDIGGRFFSLRLEVQKLQEQLTEKILENEELNEKIENLKTLNSRLIQLRKHEPVIDEAGLNSNSNEHDAQKPGKIQQKTRRGRKKNREGNGKKENDSCAESPSSAHLGCTEFCSSAPRTYDGPLGPTCSKLERRDPSLSTPLDQLNPQQNDAVEILGDSFFATVRFTESQFSSQCIALGFASNADCKSD